MNDYPIVTHPPKHGDGKIHVLRIAPKGFTHQHTFFEFVYVLRGKAYRRMSDVLVPVSAGDYYVANPLTAHGYENAQDLEIVCCFFLPEYIDRALVDCPSISSLLSNRTLYFGVPVDIPIADRVFRDTDGSMRRIVRNMEKEYASCCTGYMEMLRCYLTQILVSAARACETKIPHRAVATVMEHLKKHYAEPLSLQELSRLVGYTPQYLSSLFKKQVGMSIQVFLQRMRTEEACRLLERTRLPMSEVAAAVGYQDVRYFSKMFRRYQKLSPREYRKQAERKSQES